MESAIAAPAGAERDLITACRSGEREALRQLFLRHKDRVYAVALAALGGDEATAQDIVQEVFVRLPERLRGFRGEAQLSTWLHALTVNACRDELRRRKRAARPLEPTCAPDALAEALSRQQVHLALAALPERLRAPLVLRYFDELSYDELSEVLGCPHGTVASRLSRGLKALARKLGEEER